MQKLLGIPRNDDGSLALVNKIVLSTDQETIFDNRSWYRSYLAALQSFTNKYVNLYRFGCAFLILEDGVAFLSEEVFPSYNRVLKLSLRAYTGLLNIWGMVWPSQELRI